VLKDFLRCLNCVFFTSNSVFGERYEQKILKIISGVSLSKAYHLSHITSHSVHWDSLSHLSYKSRSFKITFFSSSHFISVGRHDQKILEKIPDVRLSSVYQLCKFQKFSLKIYTLKKLAKFIPSPFGRFPSLFF